MNSKIAICLFGLPRGDLSTWKSLQKNVIGSLRVSEVIVDTWSINDRVGHNWHGYKEPKTKNLMNYIEFWAHNGTTQKITLNTPIEKKIHLLSKNTENKFLYNQVSMWTSIYRAICVALQNDSIEYVICTRPDLMFSHPVTINLSHDELFCSGIERDGKIEGDDLFFAFHVSKADIILSILQNTEKEYYFNNGIYNPIIYEFKRRCEIRLGYPSMGSEFTIKRPSKTLKQLVLKLLS